jgi:mRNA interferase MazF
VRIRRGVIYLASLDPTIGREIAKTRPVVVVSNDVGLVSVIKLLFLQGSRN